MIRVYKIDFDLEMQHLRPSAGEDAYGETLVFHGRRKLSSWHAPEMYIDHPLLPAPDLWFPGSSAAIAVLQDMPSQIQTAFEMAGELLPLRVGDMDLVVLNVLEVYNALDHDRCQWITDKEGRRLLVDPMKRNAYTFFPNRLGESSIFKIPDGNAAMLMCVEREEDPETEFKAAVDMLKLTGIKFKLLWEG